MKMLLVLTLDKFTEGMYRFFSLFFKEYEMTFIIYGPHKQYSFQADQPGTYWLDSYKNLNKNDKAISDVDEYDMLVFCGLYGSEDLFLKWGLGNLKKTYIQFWGSDFYDFRKQQRSLKKRLHSMYKRYIINNAAGVINLIPKDYSELCKLFHPKGKHFVAPVCDEGKDISIIKSLAGSQKSEHPIRILLGNSATETNQHIPVIEAIRRFKDEDIEVVCPLSYGDEAYRNTVIDKGTELLGSKFVPLTAYMDKAEYYEIISQCRIAVFNNDRQQAMGNINAALALGCKVFIRRDTSMWQIFHDERKMLIFDIDDVFDAEFDNILSFDDKQNTNYDRFLECMDNKHRISAWHKVFESVEQV